MDSWVVEEGKRVGGEGGSVGICWRGIMGRWCMEDVCSLIIVFWFLGMEVWMVGKRIWGRSEWFRLGLWIFGVRRVRRKCAMILIGKEKVETVL